MAVEQSMGVPYEVPDVSVSRVRRSDSTAKLDEALAKASVEFEEVVKEAENQGFKRGNTFSKYADMAAYVNATRKVLGRHGLTVRSWPFNENNRIGVTTRLCFPGEWEEAEYSMPIAATTPHEVGKAITYARRYSYAAILNLAAEDDDGNSASGVTPKNTVSARDAIGPIGAVAEASKRGKKTEQQVLTYIQSAFDIPDIASLTKAEPEVIDQIIRWCENKSTDLQGDLKASVRQALTPQALFKAASRHSIPEATLREYIKVRFRSDSTKDLSPAELQEALEWIQKPRPELATT